MSLVYEALQKAEREKERKSGSVPAHQPVVRHAAAIAPGTAPAPTVAPSARRYLSVLIVGGSVAAIAALVYVVFLTIRQIPQAPPVAIPASAPAAATVAPVTPSPDTAPPSATATENDPRFRLTGIMGKPGGGFMAIINGRAVEQDQYVDGATVQKVERDRVTLNLNGREFVVRLF
jgi:hypothetical protein